LHRYMSVASLILLFAVNSPGADVKLGEYTTTFTDRSPLSPLAVLLKRFQYAPKKPVTDYDLSAESYLAYVPADYKPDKSYGLFVWVNSGDSGAVPGDWKAVFDKRHLICIGANKSGNERPVWARFGLALDAAHNMKKMYALDADRIYISGVSGGGRIASDLAPTYPEIFSGGFYIVGVNYFRDVPASAKPGSFYQTFFPPPPRDALLLDKKERRFVFLTGEHDMNRDSTHDTYNAYKQDGFEHCLYIDVPGMGHANPKADDFEKGILFLDERPIKK